MTSLQVRSKIWLEIDGKPFIGNGRERLLRAVEKTGSINSAATEVGMTYRRAWAQLKEMEKVAQFPLFKRSKGGAGGGGTHLTDDVCRLLEAFSAFKSGLQEEIDRQFSKHFPGSDAGSLERKLTLKEELE